ncbi:MAG TPA: VWA domain-containing protein, partial [Exilispira sp.]|nr:VWA domain-containing protein [Exilispira sp.]
MFDNIEIDKINKNGSRVQITQEPVAKISLSSYLIEFPIQGNEDEQFTLEFIFSSKEIKEPQISALNISTSSFKTKNVLVVSDNIKNNFFDSILRTKKVSLKDADKESLIDYKLIFFEGIPIKKIPLSLSSNIVNAYNKDNLGVFFVSEGKDIGKTGDNEIIESILPIELTPRSLKEVPDVAILIMLDTSSSMLGEKLAIAKISANQLLSQLKGSDFVSFYTFWDSYEQLFPFTRLSNIKETFSISKVEAMGGTDLYIALKDGLSKLAKQPVENRHTIIISDFQTKPSNWDSLLSFAVSNDISISVIQIGTEVDSALANKIAKTTKGNAYMATSFEAIPTILFEDRKRISRPPFKNQKFRIFDAYDDFVGSVSGMNLATPKKDSQTILKNEQSDPLFIFIKNGSKNSGFFLSDSYGFYTREILSNNYVVGLFRSYFESQIENMIEKYIIIENSNEFILLINNPMLYEPVAYIYDEQMPVLSKQMTKKAGGYFALEATMIPAGEYRLIISDSGKTYLQVPISINKNLGARNYQSS